MGESVSERQQAGLGAPLRACGVSLLDLHPPWAELGLGRLRA